MLSVLEVGISRKIFKDRANSATNKKTTKTKGKEKMVDNDENSIES